ncbi:MAG: hypothetical protein AAFO94_15310, partial [Bacteroidota bacterium]
AQRHKNMTRTGMLNRKGGALAFAKFYLRWLFYSAEQKQQQFGNYIENLAVIHAVIGKTGKTLKPEDFIYG